ncbi:DNA methyltransferase [Flaviflexus equikiangi]|uniref:DNA methyltransferase n=1 Tax=Flaviflexus equikiangi TaxID=2758573 RepID=UPI0015F52AC2|nr:DNA methyltransferase [Flaviflexus equikiangi]
MADFESIVNVDEWISDHYLTTDDTKGESFTKDVATRIKEWKENEAAHATASPLTRLLSRRLELQTKLATPDDHHPGDLLAETFGYGRTTPVMVEGHGDDLTIDAWVGYQGSVYLIHAEPIEDPAEASEAKIAGQILLGTKEQKEYAVKNAVGTIFLSENPPQFIVVTAGSWTLLYERESAPLGRYLAVDVALAAERNDTKAKGELQRVSCILSRENTEQAADGTTWWTQVLESARDHAIKVSGELRLAIRESIELIGNDVLEQRRVQGLTDEIDGNELAKQALRYLYRILFLLFAEATPELEILPTGSPEYDEGYGLTRLRELILNPPVSHQAQQGRHLYESLNVLFHLVDQGHDPQDELHPQFDAEATEGLAFRNLRADLFQSTATSLIDQVGLTNKALNDVLENLLLSRKSTQDRGFISYATLGVTELGQVYEGLMSYTGFIAEDDLYEVAPKGNPEKGSWVLPVSKVDEVHSDSFVMVEVEAPEGGTKRERRRHPKGSFVFRQSSRDRERSASFYTPQVLTEFTVGQAIEVLQEEGRLTTSEDVLTLSICEPAMGSGAFAVEAVRQLANLYLELKQDEVGERISPEERTLELQKVKAHIALHQVYGVDLNSTAVELAEISLWLDTMTADLKAPWFGLHLRQGNSLIGASRSTYDLKQVATNQHFDAIPRREPLSDLAQAIEKDSPLDSLSDRIYHFLLPAKGWGAASDAKDLKSIAGDQQKVLKNWRKKIVRKFSKTELRQLEDLSRRVEDLWRFALTRIQIAEDQIRRDIDLWHRPARHTAKNVTREEIEADLFGNPDGAYRRLRLVMDMWAAMWFWPLSDITFDDNGEAITQLPDTKEWLETLSDILGRSGKVDRHLSHGQIGLGTSIDWDELNAQEDFAIKAMGTKPIATILDDHPWLSTVIETAQDQAFFHWDLDFGAVFTNGGFDLQVGNPPWVRPRTDLDALYAEHDPWFLLAHKPTQAQKRSRRDLHSLNTSVLGGVTQGIGETVTTSAYLGSVGNYPHLQGQQPDLYRAFMAKTWENSSKEGVTSLIHPESHFTEKKAARLRRGAYERLRRHWQFVNEFKLFDIDNHVTYGIHSYGRRQDEPTFLNAASLYHPSVVEKSLAHDGTGPLPGLKDDEGKWDIRPHKDRIQRITPDVLKIWHSILEDESTPVSEARMVYTVNTEAAAVLEKLAEAPRVRELGLQFSRGWDESIDKKAGYFDVGWKHPASWDDVIVQGPHLGVSLPMQKQPNPTMSSNKDWAEIDLEAMDEDFIPATALQPSRQTRPTYDIDYGSWPLPHGELVEQRKVFRVAWRQMAATTGFRTLYPALLPPGTCHINGVISAGSPKQVEARNTVSCGSYQSSLLADFLVRSAGTNLWPSLIGNLPFVRGAFTNLVSHRYLRLNCLTRAYAPLWEELTGEAWTMETPLRKDEDRRQAQLEIDAMVALSLGVTADELCMIYRTQFPVMRRYDHEDRFDANGRKVPKEVLKRNKAAKGEELSIEDRSWTHPQSGVTYVYEYPFRQLDREADMREAYARFEKELAEGS